MGRFTTSIYKNAAPKKLKKEDTVFGGIRINELCAHDPIACGVEKVVFAGEGAGIGVVDIGVVGNVQAKVLHGHSEYVRHLEFNPFHSNILCTCSGDGLIKLWDTSAMSCSATLRATQHIHMTKFNPVADSILVAAEDTSVSLYDLNKQQKCLEQELQATSVSWSYDGRLICSGSRSGTISICDVRSRNIISTTPLLDAKKDCVHTWLGSDMILVAGFKNNDRVYQTVSITDPGTIISAVSLGGGSAQPMLCHDADTGMVYMYGKGDHGYRYCEVAQDGKITENWREGLEEPLKGISLAPKCILDVMSGEVNRLLLAHPTSLRPTPYIVPRKSYNDFHEDIFPDTRGPESGVGNVEWLSGQDGYRELVSLNPATRRVEETVTQDKQEAEVPLTPVPENKKHTQILNHLTEGHSIYKNIEGAVSHTNWHFHGLKNVQTVFATESNGFQVGSKYAAHLVTGSGGRLGIFDLCAPGENNTEQLVIVNGGTPIAFEWDPFSEGCILAVAADDALVKLWKIEDMMTATLVATFSEHSCKVTLLRYHPGVSGLLATADFSGALNLWDTHRFTMIRCLEEGEGQVAMCWGVEYGYDLYTADRNGKVTKYDIKTDSRSCLTLDIEIRSARMEATRNLLLLSTLGACNSRTIYTMTLTEPALLSKHELGSGTAVYTPLINIDMNIGYFVSRGESTVYPFEFKLEEPHIIPLSLFTSPPAQYALCSIPQHYCDVMKIEIAKFYKLCKDTVQLLTFSVPRLRKEYYQDDLYPASLDLTKPVLSVEQWGRKQSYKVEARDMCPEGVQRLSEVEIVREGGQAKIIKEYVKYKTAEKQRDELFNAFAEQVQKDAGPLTQDLMEGCEDDEWSD